MSKNETTLSVQDLSGASISFPLESLTWGQLRTFAALGRLLPDDVPVWVAVDEGGDYDALVIGL